MGKQDNYKRTQIRFPPDLYKKLCEATNESGRSLNAEIVARLEKSFDEPNQHELLTEVYKIVKQHYGNQHK